MAATAPAPRKPQAAAREAEQPGFSLQLRSPMEYLLLIRANWWWSLAIGLVAGAVFGWLEFSKPTVFTSTGSMIFQRNQNTRVLEVRAASDGDTNLRFQVEQIKSAGFLDLVATTFTEEEVATLQKGYRSEATSAPPPSPRELLARTVVAPTTELQLIRLTYTGMTPEEPPLIINRTIDVFVKQRAEQAAITDTGALDFLRKQSKELKDRIETAEKKLLEFRQDKNLISIEDTQALITARMSTLTTAVTQIRTERLELEPLVKQLQAVRSSGGDIGTLAQIKTMPEVGALRGELSRLEAEAATLDRRYLERHPKVIENATRRADVAKRLAGAIENAALSLEERLASLDSRETRLRAELAEAGQDQVTLDKSSVELNVLRRQIDTDTRTLERILTQISEQEIASQLAGANVRRWETAGPGWGLGLDRAKLLGLIAAIVLGCLVGLPILVDIIDFRLKASGDVETQLGTNLIGEIPELKSFEKGSAAFLGADRNNDLFMESFRGIYSQLTLQSKVVGTRKLVITSSVPGEGKSFVACNLAAVFAAHHLRTVIIDCDFRRPTQHSILKLPLAPGSRQWIDSQDPVPPSPESQPLPGLHLIVPNLWFFPAGAASKHPTELLTHQRFRDLIKHFESRFDVIIFDTPPVGLFPDALIVAQMCTEALFIAKFSAATRNRIRGYLARLRTAVPTLHGIVMNRMPENPRSPYYYKGYNYGSEKYVEYYKRGTDS